MKYLIGTSLCLILFMSSATAAIIFRNDSGQNANDFHIEVLRPVALSITGWTATSNATRTVWDFTAPAGGGVGTGGRVTVSGLTVVNPPPAGSNAVLDAWFTFDGQQIGGSVTPIPETSTWALLLIGIGLLGSVMRRARRGCAGEARGPLRDTLPDGRARHC